LWSRGVEMQRDKKKYRRTFPITWKTCHRCDKQTIFEVMYIHVNFFGESKHYCKECHEFNEQNGMVNK